MIFSEINFSKAGLEDKEPPKINPETTGRTCAKWALSWLHEFAADSFDKEPIEEDWGFIVRVRMGSDTLMIGFGHAQDDDPNCWRIIVADNFNRGLFPWTQRRRRDRAAQMTDFLEQKLRSADGVSDTSVSVSG